MKRIHILLTALVGLEIHTNALAFYDASVGSRKLAKDLQADYGTTGKGVVNESAKLQSAIDDVSKAGGGVVRIPKGEYFFADVDVKSNVHLEIDKDVVIQPWLEGTKKKVVVFSMGKESALAENSSIEGVGGRFTVNLSKHEPGIIVFSFGNVRNFKVANVNIHDCLTKFSSFQFVPAGGTVAQPVRPRFGTIKNASVTGADYGYGLVQVQSAESVLIQNLDGQGGVTLRLETGAKEMNDSQIGGVNRIVGKNISCTDGSAAVMISPHSMHNGVFEIDGVKSVSCGFGVRIGGSFVSKKYTTKGLEGGSFAPGCVVKNVDATFGMNAQLKPKHYQYMPAELVKAIHAEPITAGGPSFTGPSIAAVLNDPKQGITVENVMAHGFKYQKSVITESDAR